MTWSLLCFERFYSSVPQSFNIMGIGVSYLVGPLIVPFDEDNDGSDDPAVVDATRHDIQHYALGLFGLSLFYFLLVLVYYPAKPPKPPCESSSVPRTDFTRGWNGVLRNK